MIQNLAIYEVNTRVWLRKFDKPGFKAKIVDVPEQYWIDLKSKSIDYVWLYGVWQNCEKVIKETCFEPSLIQQYSTALKDWKKSDVAGSPNAVYSYTLNSKLGNQEDLIELKKKLNSFGLKLILDFFPNYYCVETPLLKEKPGIFLNCDKDYYENDPFSYFKPFPDSEVYFVHSRDPFFPPWRDTAQVNIFSEEAREHLTNELLSIAPLCDGIRCDMAILSLNTVFSNTWQGLISNGEKKNITQEFWSIALNKLKENFPDVITIAESYWNQEQYLQLLGFDFTYDKTLFDKIRANTVTEIKSHLHSDISFQNRLVRFLEKHDEERSVHLLGVEKSMIASLITYTLPGIKLFYDGQFEGKKVKLPLQLIREPEENENSKIKEFYDKLIICCKERVIKNGEWELLEPIKSGNGDESYREMLSWKWSLGSEVRLIIANLSSKTSTCRIKLNVYSSDEGVLFRDLMNDKIYIRSGTELREKGLFVELAPYKFHLLEYKSGEGQSMF
ncbi:MAG: glycosidase [Ignavibacteriaceae bacterium]|nr:glycosidase [Ignavibacteriaceae bacterium]